MILSTAHGSTKIVNLWVPSARLLLKLQVEKNILVPMENPPAWQRPPNEMNAFSLMLYAQFGIIATIATWFLPDEISEIGVATSVLVVGLLGIGFLQLLQVKNGRILTYPIIALLALSWLALGEFGLEDAVFVVIFMSVLFSFVLYIPALGFDEFGLKMSRPRRKLLLLLMLTVFATLWFGLDAIEFAVAGEAEVWDEELDEDIMVELSTAEFGATAAAAALYAVGIIVLILSGGFGVRLGPIMPEQAGLALALGNGLMGVFWFMTEGFYLEVPLDIIAVGGMMFLPVLGFFKQGEEASQGGVAAAPVPEDALA